MFKSLDIPKIRDKVRLLSDKRNSDFMNDNEIDSLIDDTFQLLYLKLVQANENYYLIESEDMNPVNKNEIPLPDDLYKLRMVKREDGFSHAVKEVTLQEVSSLDSSYWDSYWQIPTAYGYVLFSDKIKIYPTNSVSGMTFKLFYARDPMATQNEKMQVGWENFLSYKTAYLIGVTEENPRADLADTALEWQNEIKKFASERNTGIRTVTDLEQGWSDESFTF